MTTDTIAGKYRIVREIARSNDIVYEAMDVRANRRLAVKELNIPPNLTGQARRDRIERFHREARASARLKHPNIVTVYDYGQDGDRYYIAMEYLEGGTLRDMLNSRGALPIHEAVDIASQVLSALQHAHANRVIHRDVKPDNMHILPGGIVKLTDFGIARLTEEASLTGEGQVFGTPSFMSPEQIKGHHIDHRSDLFSLAIVLYEMLAGRKPFTGDSVISITYAIMESQPAPLNGISYGLEQALFKALQKDPMRRFGSADEMRQALQNADHAPAPMPLAGGQPGLGGFGGGPLNGGYGQAPVPSYGGGGPFGAPPPYAAPGGGGFGGGSYGPGPLNGPAPAPFPVQGGMPATVYAPPPASAPPNPTAGGPFVNWNPKSLNLPPNYQPPPAPFPRKDAPVLPEGVKTFFKAMAIAVLLGGVVLGGVLLFMKAYAEQQRKGAVQAVALISEEGRRKYEAGDLQGAVKSYEEAVKRGGGSLAGLEARKSLAVVYNKLGLRAYEMKDLRAAQDHWFRANELDPENESIVHNLKTVYDRIGKQDQGFEDWRSSRDGRAGSDNPAAPGSDVSLQQRWSDAQSMFASAEAAIKAGDLDRARADWQRVIELATGTPLAEQAKQRLNQLNESQTRSSPFLGND
jgi:serine/threonine-protein kinase